MPRRLAVRGGDEMRIHEDDALFEQHRESSCSDQ